MSAEPALASFLAQSSKPKILDGGLATDLEAQGINLAHKLWSARLLLADPTPIEESHARYAAAGCDAVITASYQASIPGFKEFGVDQAAARELIRRTVTLARNGAPGRFVLGSVGPYGACLADGSEYTGEYIGRVPTEEIREFHRARIMELHAAGVDALAVETLPSLVEAAAVVEVVREVGATCYVTFSCKSGEQLSDGTRFATAVEHLVREFPQTVLAVGINCTAPEHVLPLLATLRNEPTLKHAVSLREGNAVLDLVVYPNSGEAYDPSTKTWSDTGCPPLPTLAREWERCCDESGFMKLALVGGCCRVGPAEVAELVREFRGA